MAQHWQYVPVPDVSMTDWLRENAREGARIGYDPWLHTRDWVKAATAALAERGAELVAVGHNPIDKIWADRPQPSNARLVAYDNARAGKSSAEKRQEIADWLAERKADAVVLSALDSIAWTLNVRGTDVAHTPVALAYVVVNADATADLFVAPDKIGNDVKQALGNAVRVHDRSAFTGALAGFAGKRVAADPERAVAAIFEGLEAGGAKVLSVRDPAVLAKAIKNPAEVKGHKAAQARDGAALTRFLRWISEEAPKGGQTELSAAAQLEQFRRETGALDDLSFDTISATGAHGASPHYKVDEASNAPIETRPALSGRFGRPVPRRRHHRRHPRHSRWPTHRRDEGPLHPRAEGPYRARPRGVPARHHRRPARYARAAAFVGSGPRFRPWHRPRRRRVPLGP